MKEIKLLKYALKVWVTSLIVSPVLMAIIPNFHSTESWKELPDTIIIFLIYGISIGCIFSAPSLILFFIVAIYINKLKLNTITAKVLLIIVGVLLTAFSFFLAGLHDGLSFNDSAKPITLYYYITIIGGIILYKWKSE